MIGSDDQTWMEMVIGLIKHYQLFKEGHLEYLLETWLRMEHVTNFRELKA